MTYGPVIARLRAVSNELIRVFEDLQISRSHVPQTFDAQDRLGGAIDKVNEIHSKVDWLIGVLNDYERNG